MQKVVGSNPISRFPARRCNALIQADDREALLDRVSQIPVPRTVPERYADKFMQRARRLHYEFWETRSGPPRTVGVGDSGSPQTPGRNLY
jgi:hypothetical protein